ncbi:MAG: SdpI family protein [Flavobacteriaceae bacterium]|nr:SdpI family protein [Flavobacteriaceae bacterium]
MEGIFVHSLFIIVFAFGVITFIAGYLLFKFPPTSINMLYGYRTARSMKSQAAWDFAQGYAARLMMKLAAYLILFSPPLLLFNISEIQGMIIGLSFIVLASIFLILFTERAIKKRFKS